MLIQFVFVAMLLVAFYATWKRVAQNVISRREAFVWSLLWLGAMVVVILPQTATSAAHFFGVGRGADFILYGSVIVLFFLIFKVFLMLDKLERQLTEVVRHDALDELRTQASNVHKPDAE